MMIYFDLHVYQQSIRIYDKEKYHYQRLRMF